MQKTFDLTTASQKLPNIFSLQTLGIHGYPNDFGRSVCGRLLFGWEQPYAGIYSVKHTLSGRKVSRMRQYGPSNPQTVAQQAWRAVFSAGRSAWASLTTLQKGAYNERARSSRMTGFNLYMREYLSAHRL